MKVDDVIWSAQLLPGEYPNGVLKYMDKRHCRDVVTLRGVSGVPFRPGGLFENFVRFEPVGDRGGRHKVGHVKSVERESDAGDYFISDAAHVCQFLKHAEKLFGGIGVYFDTNSGVMFHLDNRPQPVKWLRVDGEYLDLNVDPVRFYRTFADELAKLPPQVTW